MNAWSIKMHTHERTHSKSKQINNIKETVGSRTEDRKTKQMETVVKRVRDLGDTGESLASQGWTSI